MLAADYSLLRPERDWTVSFCQPFKKHESSYNKRKKNEIESESEVRSEPLDMITTCNTSDSKERQEKKNGNIFDLKC